MRMDKVAKERHYFIAGTDTGVGKTLVSSALLHQFAATGLRAVGMKPVASGAVLHAGRWCNDDVSALRAASNVPVPYALDNPYLFREATAPHLAAEDERVHIDLLHIKCCYEALLDHADTVIVEGVGGLLVPLNDYACTDDLAVLLGLPVILVVGIRLGCINHALLTVRALSAKGLILAGWVASTLDPDMLQLPATLDCLRNRIPAPLLGCVPYLRNPDASSAAQFLDLAPLD